MNSHIFFYSTRFNFLLFPLVCGELFLHFLDLPVTGVFPTNSEMRFFPVSNKACFTPFLFIIMSDNTSFPERTTAGNTFFFRIGSARLNKPDNICPNPLPL